MNLRWLCGSILFNLVTMLFVAFAEPSGVAFITVVMLGCSLVLMVLGMRKLDPDNKYFD
jgi:hypothetical protein